jgi:hypothetical protein
LAVKGKEEYPRVEAAAFCGTYKDYNCTNGIYDSEAEAESLAEAAHM